MGSYGIAGKKAKLIEVVYSGVPSWNVCGVHSAVSGMEAKPAMQSGAVGHKGLQRNAMQWNARQCSAGYNGLPFIVLCSILLWVQAALSSVSTSE